MEFIYITHQGDHVYSLADQHFGHNYNHFRVPEDRLKKIEELQRMNPHLRIPRQRERGSLAWGDLMQMSPHVKGNRICYYNLDWTELDGGKRKLVGEFVRREGGGNVLLDPSKIQNGVAGVKLSCKMN